MKTPQLTPAATRYSLIPGRCIFRDGIPYVTISVTGYTTRRQAEDFAYLIVWALNHANLPSVHEAKAENAANLEGAGIIA